MQINLINEHPILIEFKKLFKEELSHFRVVGGIIRNYLLNQSLSDIDIATNLGPDELINLLKQKKYKFFAISNKYGSMGITINNKIIEITPTRSDITNYGRHAEVQFDPDWKNDADRRDFTINAFYLDFENKLYDYHNGLNDLKAKRICFIGNATDRIKEDYLRVLRAFRFESQLNNFQIDKIAINAIRHNIHQIATLSNSRIKSELFKIFESKNAIIFLQKFLNLGVFDILKLEVKNYEDLKQKWEKLESHSPTILLAVILTEIDNNIKQKLALTNQEFAKIKLMKNHQESNFDNKFIFYLIDEFGKEMAIDILKVNFLIGKINYNYFINKGNFIKEVKLSSFPINGDDIKTFGYDEGKVMGAKIKLLKQYWYESECSLSKLELLNLLKNENAK